MGSGAKRGTGMKARHTTSMSLVRRCVLHVGVVVVERDDRAREPVRPPSTATCCSVVNRRDRHRRVRAGAGRRRGKPSQVATTYDPAPRLRRCTLFLLFCRSLLECGVVVCWRGRNTTRGSSSTLGPTTSRLRQFWNGLVVLVVLGLFWRGPVLWLRCPRPAPSACRRTSSRSSSASSRCRR